MDNISEIVRKAEMSYDPEMRTKALEFKAWQQAGIELAAAEEALAAEKSRFGSRRVDLELEIAAQLKGAQPIIDRERAAIKASEKLIAECEARVEAARAALDKESAGHASALEGLRQRVAVAHVVVERVELK